MVYDIEDQLMWEILCKHLGFEDETYMIYNVNKDSFLCSYADGRDVIDGYIVVKAVSVSRINSIIKDLESVEEIMFVPAIDNKPDFNGGTVKLGDIWDDIYYEISDRIEDRL